MHTGGTWLYKSFPEARRAGDHFYFVFLHHFPLSICHIRGRVTFLNNKPDHVTPLPGTFSGSLIVLKRIRSSWPSKTRPRMFLQPALLGKPQWPSLPLGGALCILSEPALLSFSCTFLNHSSSQFPGLFSFWNLLLSEIVTKCKFVCPTHCEAKRWSLEQRKVYCRAMQEENGLMYPQAPNSRRVLAKQF